MSFTPTSPAAEMAVYLRNMIANSSTFITTIGVATYVEAKGFIDILESFPTDEEFGDYLRPRALVLIPHADYRVARPGFPVGNIQFELAIDTPRQQDGSLCIPSDILIYVTNFFDGVARDISQLGAPTCGAPVNDALLRMDAIRLVDTFRRQRDTASSDFWRARYEVSVL